MLSLLLETSFRLHIAEKFMYTHLIGGFNNFVFKYNTMNYFIPCLQIRFSQSHQ